MIPSMVIAIQNGKRVFLTIKPGFKRWEPDYDEAVRGGAIYPNREIASTRLKEVKKLDPDVKNRKIEEAEFVWP